ncbi:hypothetical protein AVEN_241365-1 [Araneus ventricosus]|uniref:Uncharacterized protein n=1 Tax=Araneus ventricosus TaxID=182803 RepID=A0A4Y2QFY9_ARAVE|nr:hypothetical protein AVEN_175005-1 [Araneus ventricosus]GBN62399.1 hypothetical protein AVEN_241365-1 [Araneus ventricosus]
MPVQKTASVHGVQSAVFQLQWRGHGGLVLRSRLWDWRVPGSKPDSTEDPPCLARLVHVKSYVVAKRPPTGVVWNFGEEGANSGVVLIIKLWFKITWFVPK